MQAEHPCNVLVVDTQGTELDVIASGDLSGVDLVIVETQELSPGPVCGVLAGRGRGDGQGRVCGGDPWEHEQYFADTLFVRAPADG